MIARVRRVLLNQGELFSSLEPCTISTVLGSCIAVCLFDERLKAGGMNHFVTPAMPAGCEECGRYGDVAIIQLVEDMQRLGARREDLQAKVFGGAVPPWVAPTSPFAVGIANAEAARAELRRLGIPVQACRTGGNSGMRITSETWSGEVRVQTIKRLLKQ
jgi:chemotaxis protein CheD